MEGGTGIQGQEREPRTKEKKYFPKAGDIVRFHDGDEIGIVRGWIGKDYVAIEVFEEGITAWYIGDDPEENIEVLMTEERLREIGVNPLAQIQITKERPT